MIPKQISVWLVIVIIILLLFLSPKKDSLDREAFFISLFVVVIISFLVIFPLWLYNVWIHYKELLKNKAPKPFKILVMQLTLTNIFSNLFSFLPISCLDVRNLKNRDLWIYWDIRWGPCGSTVATIEEIIPQGKDFVFLIRLDVPIETFKVVIFKPHSKRLNQYCFGMGCGKIFVFKNVKKELEFQDNNEIAYASVVLL